MDISTPTTPTRVCACVCTRTNCLSPCTDLFSVCLSLQHRHLLLSLVPRLVCNVGDLDDALHLLLLLVQILLKLLIDVVECLAFSPEIVD